MTNTQTIALTAGALLLYSYFRKATAAGRLNFYPANVKDLYFDGATPVITLGLAVQNTSNQSFGLKSLAGNVYANNYLVGNVSSFTPQIIGPNSQAIVTIRVRMSLLGIVNDIIEAITNKKFTQVLELESWANIDNQQVPINIKYKVGK